jgi:hypothetical protein
MSSAAIAVPGEASRGFEGVIRGATLPDLIQMECLAGTTRAVRVDRGDRVGHIFFAGGQVVHAEVDHLRGEPALVELIGWPDGRFSIEQGLTPYERTISCSWESLLIAAAHSHDETRPHADPEPSQSTMTTMPNIHSLALREVFDDPEVRSAAHFTNDGSLVEGKGEAAEELHGAFSYVVQLASLVGEALGAENLREIQIGGADSRALCLVLPEETVAMVTSSKANLNAIAKKLV